MTETGEEQALAASRRRDMDEDWEELAAKIRRSGAGRQRERDGQEDEEILIMGSMCEAVVEDQKIHRRPKGGEPRGDLKLGSATEDFLCRMRTVCDELTGHEMDKDQVRKARLNEIEVCYTALGELCTARTGRWPIRDRWVDINKGTTTATPTGVMR